MSTRSGRLRTSIVDSSPRNRKPTSPSRSPARNRKSSAERNATRQSPSRKSPSRKPSSKYPARKSPSRTVKDSGDSKEKSVPKSPAKRPPLNSNIEVQLKDMSSNFEIFRSTRSRRTEYSIKDIPPIKLVSEVETINGSDTASSLSDYGLRSRRSVENLSQRRSSRLREFNIDSVPQVARSVSKSLSKSISKSVDTYSDEEPELEPLKERSTSVTRKLSTPLPSSFPVSQISREFGGRIGSCLLMFLMPITIFTIILACSKTCSPKVLLNLSNYKSVESWLGLRELEIVVCQYVIQALILALPVLGIRGVDDNGRRYCFNALFSCFVTLNIVFALDYYNIFNSRELWIANIKLATTSYLISLLMAIVLYVKSRKIHENFLNPYGRTGYVLYDFFIGREIHPHIKMFNLKLWVYRVCNLSTIILLIVMFKESFVIQEREDVKNIISWNNYRELLSNIQWKPTVLYFTLMQIVYILYFVVNEHKVVSTFYWHSEGLGYLQLVASSLYPFYFTTISKYVIDSQLNLSNNVLWTACALFSIGIIIMLGSNNVKFEFRKNPFQHSLLHVDSMPTFHGKKLIISNLWGILRHPNYAGDILIHISLAIPGIVSSQILAASPALITIFVLLHRVWRDHVRCGRRYGAAWQRYCKRVPSVLIPKIL